MSRTGTSWMPAAPDLAEAVRRVSLGRAAGPVEDQPEQRQHHAQRDNEAGHLQQRCDQSVHQPDEGAQHKHQDQDRDHPGIVLPDEVAGNDDLHGHHRSHRQVEFAADNDEVLADGGDGDRGRPADEPDEGARLPEGGIQHDDGRQEADQQDEDGAAGGAHSAQEPLGTAGAVLPEDRAAPGGQCRAHGPSAGTAWAAGASAEPFEVNRSGLLTILRRA